MSDLASFLLARVAEDEAAARLGAGEPTYLHYGDTAAEETLEMGIGEGCNPDGAKHFRRWMPGRILAECEAKRRIVLLDASDQIRSPDYWGAIYEAMCIIALPYADHPDYDEAWRPWV